MELQYTLSDCILGLQKYYYFNKCLNKLVNVQN